MRPSPVSVALGLVSALVIASPFGCSSDTFACGTGTCERGTEVCVIGGDDRCSTCVPAPASCASCDCLPPASDAAFGDARCLDEGSCVDEDGPVVTCEAIDWGCG